MEPTTAAGIPYEDTDCTADEAVEAVEAVRATAADREGDAMIHPGAVIFLRACKYCLHYGPDDAAWVCPDCEIALSWRVEAVVQHVR